MIPERASRALPSAKLASLLDAAHNGDMFTRKRSSAFGAALLAAAGVALVCVGCIEGKESAIETGCWSSTSEILFVDTNSQFYYRKDFPDSKKRESSQVFEGVATRDGEHLYLDAMSVRIKEKGDIKSTGPIKNGKVLELDPRSLKNWTHSAGFDRVRHSCIN